MIGSAGVVLNAARETAGTPAPEWLLWTLLEVFVVLIAVVAYQWKARFK